MHKISTEIRERCLLKVLSYDKGWIFTTGEYFESCGLTTLFFIQNVIYQHLFLCFCPLYYENGIC